MNFGLIVRITKKNLSIHYQIANGEVEVLMNEGKADIPMAFCLNGGELLMNQFASEQARLGSGNAFCDYFNLIKDPYRNFRFAGEDKPIKQLLYYGLEAQFSNFLREKVYDPNPIESHRETFPLRFLFADDISNQERQFVIELFLEQGYKNVAEIQITEQLFGALLPNGFGGRVVTLSGIDGDLYVTYYADVHSKATQSKRMPGLGKDQRLGACVSLMLEYIDERYGTPFPSKEDVEDILLREATQKYVNDGSPMIWGSIIGPDGETYDYEVMRKDIERKIKSIQGSNSLVTEVKYFLKNMGAERDQVAVVLLDAVNSDYFKEMLNESFVIVVGSNEHHYKRIWGEVFRHTDFSMPAVAPPLPGRVNVSSSTPSAPNLPPLPQNKKATAPPPLPGSPRTVSPPPPPASKKPVSAPPPPPSTSQRGITAPPPPPPPTKKTAAPPPPPAPMKKTAAPPPPPPAPRKTVAPPPPPKKK